MKNYTGFYGIYWVKVFCNLVIHISFYFEKQKVRQRRIQIKTYLIFHHSETAKANQYTPYNQLQNYLQQFMVMKIPT
jgi:hypothetical protein